MLPFAKGSFCPTAATVQGYNEASLAPAPTEAVRIHLAQCDFCSASWQLLSAHTPAADAAIAMPVPPVPVSILCLAAQLPSEQPRQHVAQRHAA